MSDEVLMIHVSFAPDGTVRGIGEKPAGTSPQAWFDQLTRHSAGGYQALSGGRGVFRLPRTALAELQVGSGA